MAFLKASPPADAELPVLVAGEPEEASRVARRASGIPVAAGVWEDLVAEGKNVGVVVEAG